MLSLQQWENIAARVRARGVDVVEMPGWYDNGHGPMSDEINGVMIHHTADLGAGYDYAQWIGFVGRHDLPGPLCNVCIPRDGRVYLVAGGKAYHAGFGTWSTYNALVAGLRGVEELQPGGSGWGEVDLNPRTIGIEICGVGGTPDFTPAQEWAAVVVSAEINRELGYGPDVIAHKEATSGKPGDPNLDMGEFRRRVAAVLDEAAPAPATEAAPQLPQTGGEVASWTYWTVDPGDTMASIARAAGLRLPELVERNQHILNPGQIKPGDVLRLLPLPDGYPAGAWEWWDVDPGDTMWKIAQECGVSLAYLQAMNPQVEDGKTIKPGQRLRVAR